MINWRSLWGSALLFLLLAIIPVHAQTTITHIQSNMENSTTYVPNQDVSFHSPVTSGNLIVVAISAYTGTNADISTVTDNKGNTYTRAIRNPVIANGQHHISIWYAKNVIGGSGFTITATPASNSYVTVAAHEYSNASINDVLDQTAGNNGSTAFATSSSTGTTTQSNEMVFGAFMHEAASNPLATEGTGFTKRQSLTNGSFEPLITEDINIATSSAISSNLTWNTSLAWRGVTATFKAGSTNSVSSTPTITAPQEPSHTTTPTPSPTPSTAQQAGVLESFEGATNIWQTSSDIAGSGSVMQSQDYFSNGSNSARANTTSANSRAAVRVSFSDLASSHTWQERPGTFNWQRVRLYVPAATISQLSGSEYITLGGVFASEGGHDWYLRVKENGQLYVAGSKSDGTLVEFNIFGTIPADQWVDIEMGLHSQNGPGVKRAFAFVINGQFYGWYRQGRMDNETYDRIAYGILDTNSADTLSIYLDDWYTRTTDANPSGPDVRSAENLQSHNYLDGSGENVQLDWSTWQNDIRITNTAGLYSNTDRLQAGHNLDKMPDLTDGWAEIEIGWSGETPPTHPNSYFGPMVGFHKDVNREENLEVVPIGSGDGTVDLALEAWTNGSPVNFTRWALPPASIGDGSHIPEPGDIIRTKWQMVDSSNISVQASFFDASSNQWYTDIINGTYNISNLSGGVHLNDGYHKASSITIDTRYYSIRRYQIGTLPTYIFPPGASPTPTIPLSPSVTVTATPTPTPPLPTPTAGSASQTITRSVVTSEDDVNQDGASLTTNGLSTWIGNGSSMNSSFTGLRFNNISIPQNATIISAYLRVYSSQSQWLTITLKMSAEDTANSGPFDTSNLPSTKALTNASVNHSSNTNWEANTWYTLDDLKTVVQEVVSRGDWNNGNSISIILQGTGTGSWGRKFIQSYDGSPANAPQLVINYK